jgi:tripartite-type tricarboxylate transporter receptor subunit TctC
MHRRRYLQTLAGAALAPFAVARRVAAQTPQTRVVVGFAPGGSVDALARLVAEALAAANARPAIVDNKAGAAGRLAVELVKQAAPDGETLLVAPQGPMTLFPHVFKSLRFDPAQDSSPITRLATGDFALTAGPLVPATDLAGLRSWLKTAGDKAAYASPGAGTLPHFIGVAVARQLGASMTHVPYQGSAKSMVDLSGGHIALAVSPVTEALELHKAGRVRILATTGRARSSFVPEVPTFGEQGLDVEAPLWFAAYGPAGMAAATVQRLRAAIDMHLGTPQAAQHLARLGLVAAPLAPEALEALRRRETAFWEPIVKESGFTPGD